MKIVEARRDEKNGRTYFKILVNPDAPEDEQIYEEFVWPPGVDEATMLREMKLLIEDKYFKKETTLDLAGTTL
jgi:hypothetical protein